MKSSRVGYYIQEGVNSIFTHSFMSFASVCIITACLIIMGSFVLLAANVNDIIGEFESENIILAFIREDISETDARATEVKIRTLDNVENASFISREEAMEAFVGKFDDKTRFENLDSSVLRHRYAVFVDDVAKIAETTELLRQIPEIAMVNVNFEIAEGFVKVRTIVSVVSFIIVAILLVISLFIMSNTIKLATFERREEIAIMKMVGATNSFIRWPFVFEGFLLGISGAIVAFIALWAIYLGVAGSLVNPEIGFISAIPFTQVALPMLAGFGVIGFGVGTGGSIMAIKKYLKV